MRKQFIASGLILSFYFCANLAFAQPGDVLGKTKSENEQNAKQIPHLFKPTLAGKAGGDITKKEFHEAKKLVIPPIDNDTSWQFVSCTVAIAGKGTDYRVFELKDGVITDEIDSIVTHVPAGLKIYFEYMKIGKK